MLSGLFYVFPLKTDPGSWLWKKIHKHASLSMTVPDNEHPLCPSDISPGGREKPNLYVPDQPC